VLCRFIGHINFDQCCSYYFRHKYIIYILSGIVNLEKRTAIPLPPKGGSPLAEKQWQGWTKLF
jgi:hypothetical protein